MQKNDRICKQNRIADIDDEIRVAKRNRREFISKPNAVIHPKKDCIIAVHENIGNSTQTRTISNLKLDDLIYDCLEPIFKSVLHLRELLNVGCVNKVLAGHAAKFYAFNYSKKPVKIIFPKSLAEFHELEAIEVMNLDFFASLVHPCE